MQSQNNIYVILHHLHYNMTKFICYNLCAKGRWTAMVSEQTYTDLGMSAVRVCYLALALTLVW